MTRRSRGYRYASESTLNQQINARRDAYAARNQTFNNNFYLFKMRGSRQQSLTDIADKLARSIQEQWAREIRVQTLNDHAPLRVSWGPADDALGDSWDSLARLAAEGAGGTGGLPQDSWAAGPADLAGSGPELPATLARVPTGRLVVLGEGGTGKTMLMTRLAVDLIKQRKTGSGPVPVVLPLASWDPASQDLADRITELEPPPSVSALSCRTGHRRSRAPPASAAANSRATPEKRSRAAASMPGSPMLSQAPIRS